MDKDNLIFYKLTPAWEDSGDCLIHKTIIDLLRPYGRVIFNDDVGADLSKKRFVSSLTPLASERLSRFSQKSFMNTVLWSGVKYRFSKTNVYFVTGPGAHVLSTPKQAMRNLGAALFVGLIKLLGITTVRIGLSQEINGFWPRLSERFLALFVDHYYVRDSISLTSLQQCGIKSAHIAPDLSFAYSPKYIQSGSRIGAVKKLGVFFNNHVWSPENRDSFIFDSLNRFVDSFIAKFPNSEIVFAYQVEEDRSFVEMAFERFNKKNTCKVYFRNTILWLEDAPTFYQSLDYVISNRLHVLLLAYKLGCVPIPLIDVKKQPKITGIFRDIGLEDCLLNFGVTEYEVPNVDCVEKLKMVENKCNIRLVEIVDNLFSETK